VKKTALAPWLVRTAKRILGALRIQVVETLVRRKRPLIRSIDADVHVELFLVAAVSAILVIRFYLRMTGYPQLGGSSLHIAHMLWGGLIMMLALLLLLTYINRDAIRFAAFLGGIGFGTFIDEVGKFVTRENDYFYQPSFALMYVLFVLLVIGVQAILRRLYTHEEYLLNALQEMEDLALHDLDVHERRRALQLLDRSDPANPLVEPLRRLLHEAPLVPPTPGPYARLRGWLRRRYEWLVVRRRFQLGLVVFFVGWLLFKVAHVVILVFFPGWLPSPDGRIPHLVQRLQDLGVADWGQLGSTVISALFVAAGVAGLARSRRFAYRMFKRSVLVTIFITQVFMFYDEQLSAIVGLAINGLLLLALQAAIDFDQQRAEDQAAEAGDRLGDGAGAAEAP